MITPFFITLREVLEVALILVVVLRCLNTASSKRFNSMVYSGLAVGVGLSIIGAALFNRLAGGFTGRAEEIFEGVTMAVGALLLCTMIIWMKKTRGGVAELKAETMQKIENEEKWGLFLLVVISVLREGIELILFLSATGLSGAPNELIGALSGALGGMLVGYLVYKGSLLVDLQKFFTVTSVVLIVFAGGLLMRSVHEFEEARVLPHIEITPNEGKEDDESGLHELLEETVGLTAVPTAAQLVVLIGYMGAVTYFYKKASA